MTTVKKFSQRSFFIFQYGVTGTWSTRGTRVWDFGEGPRRSCNCYVWGAQVSGSIMPRCPNNGAKRKLELVSLARHHRVLLNRAFHFRGCRPKHRCLYPTPRRLMNPVHLPAINLRPLTFSFLFISVCPNLIVFGQPLPSIPSILSLKELLANGDSSKHRRNYQIDQRYAKTASTLYRFITILYNWGVIAHSLEVFTWPW